MSRSTNVQRRSSSVGAEARGTALALVEELGTVFQGQPSPLRRGGHVRPSQIRSVAPAAMQEPTALQQQGSAQDDSEVVFRPRGQTSREERLQRLMARQEALAAEMTSFMAEMPAMVRTLQEKAASCYALQHRGDSWALLRSNLGLVKSGRCVSSR